VGFFSRLSGGTTPHLADAMTVLAGDLVDVVGESYRHLLDGAEAEAHPGSIATSSGQ